MHDFSNCAIILLAGNRLPLCHRLSCVHRCTCFQAGFTVPAAKIAADIVCAIAPARYTAGPAPALQLVQFERVFVRAGTSVDVTLVVPPRQLALLVPAPAPTASPRTASADRLPAPTHGAEGPLQPVGQGDAPLPEWWVLGGVAVELFVGGTQPEYGPVSRKSMTRVCMLSARADLCCVPSWGCRRRVAAGVLHPVQSRIVMAVCSTQPAYPTVCHRACPHRTTCASRAHRF